VADMSLWACHCGNPLKVFCVDQRGLPTCVHGDPLPRFLESAEAPLRAEIERLELLVSELERDLIATHATLQDERDLGPGFR
jgi:hypothetical protein